ncbi:TolC family protein [Ohtaekwangia koreensis]|uniref:Outer membrane protein TolC n=1 Tax=Ohtaekwangia koreensis TaxID=688867 RepID=A0A1T5M879_9BACT|nr:TolC family protein [Ohtaekwangia koreensis]SKC84214.1 Outer membrane protein TolC [Ohtaekwangia koreensis]
METFNPKIKLAKLFVMAAFAIIPMSLQAQSALDDYVHEGLKNNLLLQQRNLSLQQAQQSLQIAKSYFMPSVTLLGDYTSGSGGRSISIPVGDLLNPVYTSLNQMTQSDQFPQIDNVSQNFFPKNFYDARVRTSLPIINTDLYVNRTIQGQQVMMREFEVDIYKRQLVLDIKTAYFNYLTAVAAIKIYESGLALVNKNVEINESLLRNGRSLPANYLRSKSEAERVKSELNSARNTEANAKKYFNFLLNKNLDSTIDINITNLETTSIPDTTVISLQQREELQLIKTARDINQSTLRLNRLTRVPKVNAFLDLGSQASDWKYNNDSRYYLVGVQLSLPLFQGFRNATTIRQSKLEIQKTEYNLLNTTRQLQLAESVAKNDLQTTVQNYLASREQLKSAQSYFNLIEKGYQQGVNTLIEFLDARNQLTSSQLQQSLRLFEMLTAEAKLERETASYTLQY